MTGKFIEVKIENCGVDTAIMNVNMIEEVHRNADTKKVVIRFDGHYDYVTQDDGFYDRFMRLVRPYQIPTISETKVEEK